MLVAESEWEMDIKEYSDLILAAVGADESLVTYKEAEPFTTKSEDNGFFKSGKGFEA